MKMKELLEKFNACKEARDWVGDKTLEEAWNTCHRGDWMLWLYQRMYPNNLRELTFAKGHCANTVRHLMKDDRSLKAIDTAITFGEGRIDRDELDAVAVAAAAYAAAAAAYADAYADAYAAAAAAAAAAYAAAYADAAAVAAAAYAAAAYTAYTAYTAAAKKQNQQLTADICRQYLKIV